MSTVLLGRRRAARPARIVPPVSVSRRAFETTVFILAGLFAWAVLYATVLSSFQHGHQQSVLYGHLRSALAEGTVPVAEPIAHGTPVAMLDAPELGWHHEVVVEGTMPGDLQAGPGHAIGTVLPGQNGTSVLMGRAVSFGGPFGSLGSVRVGYRVTVTTGQGTFVYEVSRRRASGASYQAPAAGTSRLTLITLAGEHAWTPNSTLFVDLTLVGKPVADGAVVAADPSGAPMSRDLSVGTVAQFVLCVQLLLLTVVAFLWARRRWSAIGAWACGAPTFVMALWLAGSFAARMALPNLL